MRLQRRRPESKTCQRSGSFEAVRLAGAQTVIVQQAGAVQLGADVGNERQLEPAKGLKVLPGDRPLRFVRGGADIDRILTSLGVVEVGEARYEVAVDGVTVRRGLVGRLNAFETHFCSGLSPALRTTRFQ